MKSPGSIKRRQQTKTPAPRSNVHLKQLAEYLHLNPATVSVVLNDVPGRSIPQAPRDRIKAVAKQLMSAGYFYFTAHHRHQTRLIEDYTRMLIGRGAQGIIAVDTHLEHPISIPVVAVAGDMTSPKLGYPVVQQLLATKQPFTALVAFNDISAIGAIRALQDANLRVPADVSVIGFDNINAADSHRRA